MRRLDESAEREEALIELNAPLESDGTQPIITSQAEHFDTIISTNNNSRSSSKRRVNFEDQTSSNDKNKNINDAPLLKQIKVTNERYNLNISLSPIKSKDDAPPPKPAHSRSSSVEPSLDIEEFSNEVSDKAFVTFDTYTAASIARQSMHSYEPGSMKVKHAPEPRDILWENIGLPNDTLSRRHIIVESLATLIIFLYVVPVSLVSLLVSKRALLSYSETLVNICNVSTLMTQLVSMIQPITLVLIQQVLPPVFCALGKIEGRISFSNVLGSAFSRYFMFQIVNVFFVTVIAGSFFDAAAKIVDNPQKAFELLGMAIPKQSAFFTNYILLKTFIGLGAELVRIVPLLQASARSIFCPFKTARDRRGVVCGCRSIDEPSFFLYHKILAQDMLVATVAIVFSIVAPLVLFPCATFFLLSRILWTYQLLFVYESVFETGGIFWPKVFRR